MFGLPQSLLFLLQIVALYFISRVTIQEVFYFFAIFTKNRKIIFSLTSLVFFPGTILHEMSHFIMAMIMMLRVRDVKILPEMENNSIKLGKVLYEKKDIVRGVIVGIAPILAGILFFLFVSFISVSFKNNPFLTGLLIYAIFAISTTMFSSKQDLIDIVFLIPFVIIITFILYVFKIPIVDVLQNFSLKLNSSLVIINRFLFYSFVIHVILIMSFKSLRKLIKK